MNDIVKKSLKEIIDEYEQTVSLKNQPAATNGVCVRFINPVVTRNHIPPMWRYDFNPATNPFMEERFSFNATFNSGALKWRGKYILIVRVEGADRKSFFAIAESDSPVDGFRFREKPIVLPLPEDDETNVYDMRLTFHEDGWIYGIFCSEKHDPDADMSQLGAAVASAGIVRTRDLENWERLPNLKSKSQQRNVVLHPEFIDGKYALYTRPQDDFITAGSGQGICWTLVDDITNAVVTEEKTIDRRYYHTIKEEKNGEGPHPIRTEKGWLHLAHGVRKCASGLRYVLYAYMTSLEDPFNIIAAPAGYILAPLGEERVGDVSNVLFCNGWIKDEDGVIYIYYASSDTRLHVAATTVDRMVDYCFNTAADGYTTHTSVETVCKLIDRNKTYLESLKNAEE